MLQQDIDRLALLVVDQAQSVYRLDHLRLAGLLDDSFDPRIGMHAHPGLCSAAVARGVLALAMRVLRLFLWPHWDAADWLLGIVPERLCLPFSVPGARLLPPQDDHNVVALELIGPAYVAEMSDVSTGIGRAHWQFAIGVPPRERASHSLIGHHQCPPFADLSGPFFLPVLPSSTRHGWSRRTETRPLDVGF
jgi:hypothetical protein